MTALRSAAVGVEPDVTRGHGWTAVRLLVAAAVLAVLVWRLGTGPFLDGLHRVDAWALAVGAAAGLVSTLCCAWRWRVVSQGLGVGVPMRTAIASYYRSQLLNLTLPGGVVGDVHRGVRHGRDVGDVGRGLRAVGWERSAGQAVQVAITLVVLLMWPSPLRAAAPVLVGVAVVVAGVVVLLARHSPRHGTSRRLRTLRAASADLREGLLARRAWPAVLLASTVVVAAHCTSFVVAAHTAGSTASPGRLLPLALLTLLVMALPLTLGGWGPREGAAAWAFGVAGLGTDVGVATAVVYGVMVLVASLPGAVVLLLEGGSHG